MTTVQNIYDYINSFAPFETQEEWDNSGFQIGDLKETVTTCVVALDVTAQTVAYAKQNHAQLIISHHPVIFSKLHAVTSDTIIYDLVHSGLHVIAAHTNYDLAQGGINDALCAALALQDINMVDKSFLRVGTLPHTMDTDTFARYVKEKLKASQIRYSAVSRQIKTVAVCGGAGADFIAQARVQADAYVTGDASYHNILDAQQAGFCLVAAGHYDTEMPGVSRLRRQLAELFTDVRFLDPEQATPVRCI